MLQPQSKFSLKYLFILILCSGLLPILTLPTQGASSPFRPFLLISHVDTIPVTGKKDTATKQAKVDTLNLKLSADSITSPVDHKAEDSMILEVDATRKVTVTLDINGQKSTYSVPGLESQVDRLKLHSLLQQIKQKNPDIFFQLIYFLIF